MVALTLAVPFEEKDDAKSLGARWDPAGRTWYLPPGTDTRPFLRWLPAPAADADQGGSCPADVLAMPRICWRCDRPIQSIVGVLVRSQGRPAFAWFDDVSGCLSRQLDQTTLARTEGIGRIAFRRSRVRPEGYLANTCVRCGALQGSFPLREELGERLGDDGDVRQLKVIARIQVPLTALAEAEPV